MKKMNHYTLEIEPGTGGYEQIDSVGFNRALNEWAKRRGIRWDNPFRRNPHFIKQPKTETPPCESAQ
jgi:hypothetical protein